MRFRISPSLIPNRAGSSSCASSLALPSTTLPKFWGFPPRRLSASGRPHGYGCTARSCAERPYELPAMAAGSATRLNLCFGFLLLQGSARAMVLLFAVDHTVLAEAEKSAPAS